MMEDVLAQGKLKVSSNEAMSNSLTDSSTETFWESRDEPRSKPKMITITFDGAGNTVFGVAVHIDNQKDAGVRRKWEEESESFMGSVFFSFTFFFLSIYYLYLFFLRESVLFCIHFYPLFIFFSP